jgi:hypothetical protein
MPADSGKRRSRAQWEELMTGYEAGNQTQHEFCAERGIAYSSFCYWRKRLRSAASNESTIPSLIELPALVSDETPSWRVVLELGAGIVLRIS